ncbi:MAG: sulfotransferase [Planctomycetes bacterium]|nr:sulfotransferase [Planctomycetota bacterium]
MSSNEVTPPSSRPAAQQDGQGDLYPWYTPRPWCGMTVGIWLKLLAKNRFAIAPSRWPMAAAVSAFSPFNSLLRVASELRYGAAARDARVQPPLFVLGHWRSGTTLLHELLVLDEQFTFPNSYQCLAPHHFLFTERVLAPVLQHVIPKHRPMDAVPISVASPQEDEFALCNLGAGSPYLTWAFPFRAEGTKAYLDLEDLPEAAQQKWRRAILWFARRLTVARPARIVFKSPGHTARVRTLLDVFPDAQFVHIVRDPYVLFASTVRTWRKLIEATSLQGARAPDLEALVLEQFVRMYRAFERDRSLLGPQQLCEIRYEDLVQDPIAVLKGVYEQLGLGDFERARPRLTEFFAEREGFPVNRYQLTPAQEQRIAEHWGEFIERMGYEPSRKIT